MDEQRKAFQHCLKLSPQKRSIIRLTVSISATVAYCIISQWIISPVLAEDMPGQLLSLINDYRQSLGLYRLKYHPHLSLAAQRHSDDMVRRSYFAHCDPENRCLKQRLQKVGYRPRIWAENLAAGLKDPAVVLQKWIDSPTHHRNLLNPDVEHAGIGYNQDTVNRMRGIWTLVVTAPF